MANKILYELTTEYEYQKPEEYCYNDEVSDVVKIRVYGKDNENKYCTAVNETFNIEYVKELKCWYPSDEKIKDIYEAFEKRGVVLKHNVFKEHIDLEDNFEIDRSNPHFPPWLRPSSKRTEEDQVLKRSLKKPVIHIGYI